MKLGFGPLATIVLVVPLCRVVVRTELILSYCIQFILVLCEWRHSMTTINSTMNGTINTYLLVVLHALLSSCYYPSY